MIYGILSHEYDIISGIFPKYLQITKKKINNTFQRKFSNLHGSIVDSLFKKSLSPIHFVKIRLYNFLGNEFIVKMYKL